MGILLRPSHNISSNEGWNNTFFDEIVKDIDININDIGFWGKEIFKSSVKDAHSILYSIPNPWASAYLYDFILTGGNLGEKLLKIQTRLFDLMINLLYEYAFNRELELLEINIENNLKSPIKHLIPSFLKFDQNKIYVFRNIKTKKVVGGLSKRSLVWVSQMYDCNNNLDAIKNDDQFKLYMNHLKENNKVVSKDYFDKFWGLNYIRDLISDLPKNKEIEIVNTEALLPMVKRYGISGGKYYIEEIKTYVFTEKVIDEEKELLPGIVIDEDWKKTLKEVGKGEKLPKIEIEANWVVIDKFIKTKVLRLEALSNWSDKLPYKKEKIFQTLDLDSGLLYPIDIGLLKALKGKLELLKFSKNYNVGDKHLFNLQISCGNAKTSGITDMEVKPFNKILEIWPPFKSKYVDNYVFEYDITSKLDKIFDNKNYNLLKFYDREGKEINTEINKFEDFNVYKLKDFPTYIIFNEEDDGNNLSGVLRLNEMKQYHDKPKNETVEIAVDFGTTRTNVAYKIQSNEPVILEFSHSLPIVVASSDYDLEIIKQRFIPYKWIKIDTRSINLNNIKKDPQPSIPFLSIYRNWLTNRYSLDYEMDSFSLGSIYFNLPDKGTNESILSLTNTLLITNLKWGIDAGSVAKYRSYFLQQLLEMILVEFEARGYDDLNIYWSYPKAFSQEEFNQLKTTWNILQDKFNK